MYRTIAISCFLYLFSVVTATATSTTTCHCFTDRSYNPAKPTLADPYFLATAQNSFFAAIFAVDKRLVVLKKQGGAASDDMWVAYWLAARGVGQGDVLLDQYEKLHSWSAVLVASGIHRKALGEPLATELVRGAPSARLAQLIVDDVLVKKNAISVRELAGLRQAHATNQEVILIALLTARSRIQAMSLYNDVKNGRRSWGAWLAEVKIPSAAMLGEFAAMVK